MQVVDMMCGFRSRGHGRGGQGKIWERNAVVIQDMKPEGDERSVVSGYMHGDVVLISNALLDQESKSERCMRCRNSFLNPSILRMNDLPRAKPLNLAICGRENPDHATRRPIDEPLLALADDKV